MKNIGVFVDVSNLYYCVEKQYKKKIDYQKYLDVVKELGRVKFAIAYAAVMGNQADAFLHALATLGFEIKTKVPKEYPMSGGGIKRKCDFDVQIAVDMINRCTQMDLCILGSADGDLTPAVNWIKDHGVPTVIFASGISNELAKSSKAVIEIPPSVLI